MSTEEEDTAWWLARERGQPLPSLSGSAVARYAELEALIAELPATPVSPPDGWRQRMLAALQAAPTATITNSEATSVATPIGHRKVRRSWVAPVAVAAMAAVLALVLWNRRTREGENLDGLQIAVAVEPGPMNRSPEPSVGDKLVVKGIVDSGDGELRVYDASGAEQGSCRVPGPTCSIEHVGPQTTLVLTIEIRTKGAFRPLLFSPPLGRPSSGLTSDIAWATNAGRRIARHEPTDFH